MIVVGRYCGSISMAAISATSQLVKLVTSLFIGFSVGVGVAVAHGLGGNRHENVHRTVHTALPIVLIAGTAMTVIGLILSKQSLIWLGTPESLLSLSTLYLTIYFSGMIFTLLYNFCAAILRAAGDTRSPLLYMCISGVLNVVLNVVFIIVFHMNVAGVALATVISQGVSAALVVIALVRRKDACRLQFKKIRIYKEPLCKIIRIGLPSGIQGALFSISNLLIHSSINSFDNATIITGHGAASDIDGFLYAAMSGFYQTTVNFVGQNLGARQFRRIKRVVLQCLICVLVIGGVGGLAIYMFGEQLLSLYIVDSEEAIFYGLLRMVYITMPYFLCGLSDVCTGALRGLGASTLSMCISLLGICGTRILWIYTVFRMPAYHTMEGLYLSYPVSWVITFGCQFVAYSIIFKKIRCRYFDQTC